MGRAQSKRGNPPSIREDVIDAPEYYDYARAMGLLTWGTWDATVRPFQARLEDFLQAYPARDPMRFQGTMLTRTAKGEFGPAESGRRLERFMSIGGSFGSLAEILARYGLKRRNAPLYAPRPIGEQSFREAARLRNQRLRQLHGSVDIEAENMDEAKAAELDRLEKKEAAEQIRRAREELRRELERAEAGDS